MATGTIKANIPYPISALKNATVSPTDSNTGVSFTAPTKCIVSVTAYHSYGVSAPKSVSIKNGTTTVSHVSIDAGSGTSKTTSYSGQLSEGDVLSVWASTVSGSGSSLIRLTGFYIPI